MTQTPTIDDIHAAAGRLAGVAVRTPLVASDALDRQVGGTVLLKCENLQETGSFKFRGAFSALSAIAAGERSHGVVAASSGNHAQGVARAAERLGMAATAVMPADAPRVKIERTRAAGARIVNYDRATENRDAIAARIVAETGARLVHPYNDPFVIAGQGTVGLEIADQCDALGLVPDRVVVPCGGGGLSAGVGLAIRARFPGAEIVLVEPQGFDDYARSLDAGQPVSNVRASGSIQDALMAPSPGALGFAINARNGARAVSVSDTDALAAMAWAARILDVRLEPGGAAALAAVLSARVKGEGGTSVVVLSGGNVDDVTMQRALSLTVPGTARRG